MRDTIVIYHDDFVSIVQKNIDSNATLMIDGCTHIIQKGSIRFWLYNSDMSELYSTGDNKAQFGFKNISEPSEGIIRAEFFEGEVYLFNLYGKLIKPFSFTRVTDFQNGFARAFLGNSDEYCLVDHYGNLILKNSNNKVIIIPDEYAGGAIIDENHYALKCVNRPSYILLDEHLKPILLKHKNEAQNIYFKSFSKGVLKWYVLLKDCYCYPNQQTPAEECLFNLSTNVIVSTDNFGQFEPIGNGCIHNRIEVDNVDKEWDSDERHYDYYTNKYSKETLIFENGATYEFYCDIEPLENDKLILIKGRSYIINDKNDTSKCGCLSYSGNIIIPIIYDSIKKIGEHIEVELNGSKYQYTLLGNMILNGKTLPKCIHHYFELGKGLLKVFDYFNYKSWLNNIKCGVWDTNSDSFILPIEFEEIIATENNSFIVRKKDTTGVWDRCGLIGANQKILIPIEYESLTCINEKHYICSKRTDNGLKYGIIDKNNKVIFPLTFDAIYTVDNNRLVFKIDSYNQWECRSHVTDSSFNTIVQNENGNEIQLSGFWDTVGEFHKKHCRFVDSDGYWGIVNDSSGVASTNRYEAIKEIKGNGYYFGEIGGSFYFINPEREIEKKINCNQYWGGYNENESNYIYISNDNGKGLIDTNGETILECEYSSISVESDYITIEKDGNIGKSDLDGNIIIPCQYKEYRQLSNGYYIVKGENSYVLSPYGGVVSPRNANYNNLFSVNDNCIKSVLVDNNKHRHYGLLSSKGKLKREPDLSYIGKFIEGEAIANYGGITILRYNHFTEESDLIIEGGKYGVINENGQFVVNPKYDYIGKSKDGYRIVMFQSSDNKKYGLINNNGESVIECCYSYLREVVDGMIVCAIGGEWEVNGNKEDKLPVQIKDKKKYLVGATWGIMDLHGKYIFEPFADVIKSISERKVTYKLGSKYGIIDIVAGTRQITDYDYLGCFHEGRCVCGKIDDKYGLLQGYIKEDYSVIVPCENEKASAFKDGIGVLTNGRSKEFVDLNGNITESYTEESDSSYDSGEDYDWERETWYAMTDGQYGDYPGSGVDYDFLG